MLASATPAAQAGSLMARLEDQQQQQQQQLGYRGDIIFADLASEGGDQALHILRNLRGGGAFAALGKCHFGLACFVNYSIGAATRADKIVILDYDPVVVRFNRLARDLLVVSSSAQEFRDRLVEACCNDADIRARKFFPRIGGNAGFDNLRSVLDMPESFLHNEEDFRHIKQLAECGNIHILQGSIYDGQIIKQIVDATLQEGFYICSLFISNVYDWDDNAENRQLLSSNIRQLCTHNDPARNTVIVEVVTYHNNSAWRVNMVYYTDPANGHTYNPAVMRGDQTQKQQYYPAALLLL